jgi:hypothetical protein
LSLLLDLEEVRALVRGPDHGGLTGLQIKDKLSTTTKVAAALHQAWSPEGDHRGQPHQGCATHRDGSLTEITSVKIPYNALRAWRDFEFAQLTAARSDAQHAPLRAARRRLIYGPKEGDSR